MPTRILLSALWFLALAATTPADGGDLDVDLRETFTRTASVTGRAYAAGREVLLAQGSALRPLLDPALQGEDWRARRLARVLRLRLDEPDGVRLVEQGLREDPAGLVPGAAGLPTDDDLAAIAADVLWETFGAQRAMPGSVHAAALELVGRGRDPDLARTLLHLVEAGRDRDSAGSFTHALAAMGKPVVSALQEAARAEGWVAPLVALGALGRVGGEPARASLEEAARTLRVGDAVEAACRALGDLGDARSVPVVFESLVASARSWSGGVSWDTVEYEPVRDGLLAFGDVALPHLRTRVAEGTGMPERALATGLLLELEHPEEVEAFYGRLSLRLPDEWYGGGLLPLEREADPSLGRRAFFWTAADPVRVHPPLPLVVERAVLLGSSTDLAYVRREAGTQVAFDVIAWRFARRGQSEPARLAIWLAELDAPRALAFVDETLRERPGVHVRALVEAVLVAGLPEGAPLLERLEAQADEAARVAPPGRAEHEATAALARAGRLALSGSLADVLPLLHAEAPALREAAAVVIVQAGAIEGLPTLVAAAAHQRGARHDRLVATALVLGSSALPALDQQAAEIDDARVRLLAEALGLRIRDPALAVRTDRLLVRPPWRMHAPPGLDWYREIGRRAADGAGLSALPLLEAAVMFGESGADVLVAAAACGRLAQERSIPVVLDAAADARLGAEEVAVLLADFGEAGIRAAKAIPVPDPTAPRFVGRAGRYRGGTRALVESEEPLGVERLLEGLAVPAPADGGDRRAWEHAAEGYLRMAGGVDDPRLLDAGLALLSEHAAARGHMSWQLLHAALGLLARPGDPRVEEWLLRALAWCHDSERRATLDAWRQAFGTDVVSRLVSALRSHAETSVRAGAALALGDLATAGRADAGARADRDVVVPALLEALPLLGLPAARGLVTASFDPYGGRGIVDRRALGPLATWLAASDEPSPYGTRLFLEARDPEATSLLLDAYEAAGRCQGRLATVLAHLGRPEVIPELVERSDLASLAALGPAGQEALHGILRTGEGVELRARAAELLEKAGYVAPYEDVAGIFQDLVVDRLWHPGLRRTGGEATWNRRQELAASLARLAGYLLQLDPPRAVGEVKAALLAATTDDERRMLTERLAKAEAVQPALVGLPAAVRLRDDAVEGPPPPFLVWCDRWAASLAATSPGRPIDVDAAATAAILAGGVGPLGSGVELSYPPGVLTEADVAAQVAALADPLRRRDAVARLALGSYHQRFLDAALDGAGDDAGRLARAIRAWRRRSEPVHLLAPEIRGHVQALLVDLIPQTTVRAFTLAHLPRLARIDEPLHTFLYYEPLAPLLASVRMSPSEEERRRLDDFVQVAAPHACLTALYVMVRTIRERDSRWWPLPEQRFSDDTWKLALRKTGRFLLSDVTYERQAFSFALSWMRSKRGFDAAAFLAREHPDEAVRRAAAEAGRQGGR